MLSKCFTIIPLGTLIHYRDSHCYSASSRDEEIEILVLFTDSSFKILFIRMVITLILLLHLPLCGICAISAFKCYVLLHPKSYKIALNKGEVDLELS